MCFSIFSLSSYRVLTSALTINLCPFYMQSVKYHLTVSHLLYCCYSQAACAPNARVNQVLLRKLVINRGECGMASSTTSTRQRTDASEVVLLPVQRVRSSAQTQERKKITHKPCLVTDFIKAYGLLRPLLFGGLLAVGGGRYSPRPSPQTAGSVLCKHLSGCSGAHPRGLTEPFPTQAELCWC